MVVLAGKPETSDSLPLRFAVVCSVAALNGRKQTVRNKYGSSLIPSNCFLAPFNLSSSTLKTRISEFLMANDSNKIIHKKEHSLVTLEFDIEEAVQCGVEINALVYVC